MTRPGHSSRADRLTRATYRIRVAGVLGGEWSRWTDGMTVTVLGTGGEAKTTELYGTLPDQTALMGVLDRLDSHGARLLGLECVEAGDVDGGAPDPVVHRRL